MSLRSLIHTSPDEEYMRRTQCSHKTVHRPHTPKTRTCAIQLQLVVKLTEPAQETPVRELDYGLGAAHVSLHRPSPTTQNTTCTYSTLVEP